jgi:hypothetical protein
MSKMATFLIYLSLVVASVPSNADTLQPGDRLLFNAATSFAEGYFDYFGGDYDIAHLDAQDGLTIGTAQPAIPGIDQPWISDFFGIDGVHRTTTAVTSISDTTLNFSGWVMTLSGEDYAFGSQHGIANYTYDGTNYTLDYYWDSSYNGNSSLGTVQATDYHLHLEGVVVPIPASIWLVGSGLLGLIGTSKRKKAA